MKLWRDRKGIDDLRNDGVFVTVHTGEKLVALLDRAQQVASNFVFHRSRGGARVEIRNAAQLAERARLRISRSRLCCSGGACHEVPIQRDREAAPEFNSLRCRFLLRAVFATQSSVDAAPTLSGTSAAAPADRLPTGLEHLLLPHQIHRKRARDRVGQFVRLQPLYVARVVSVNDGVADLEKLDQFALASWHPPIARGRRDNRQCLPAKSHRRIASRSSTQRCETARVPQPRCPFARRGSALRPRALPPCSRRAPALSAPQAAFRTRSCFRCSRAPFGGIAAQKCAEASRRRAKEQR